MDRRQFVHRAATGVLAANSVTQLSSFFANRAPYKAVAFDAFPIFDPRPVAALCESFFPGKGAELTNAWRTRQFEYQWLRALGGRYADFMRTTDDALAFATNSLHLELGSEKREQLVQAYARLKAWPDVSPALERMRGEGLRLALLSNMTAAMLTTNIAASNLNNAFDHVLSTDSIRTYKPDPRAYQLGVDALKLRREEILFVAFAGWDAAGAGWFGYPTVWVNRAESPTEELGVAPLAVGHDLGAVASAVSTPK
ncbi:MAG TPA: haloacid dehalogenase type II [Polyangiaceae bacterium]